jgi:murein DD-endopeptidase MepM/ murein hydrolase activator NlpD
VELLEIRPGRNVQYLTDKGYVAGNDFRGEAVNNYHVGDVVTIKAIYKASNATDTFDDGKTYHDSKGTVVTITDVDTRNAVWYKVSGGYVAENDIIGIYNTTLQPNFCFPVDYIAISTPFSPSHLGTDYAWNSAHGGQNVPIYAIADGGTVIISKWSDTVGNYVVIEYHFGGMTYLVRYKHMLSRSVSVGDTVSMHQQIGVMGNTGSTSNGTHLHMDLIIIPDGTTYNEADRATWSVDSILYCKAQPYQEVGDVTDSKYHIMRAA